MLENWSASTIAIAGTLLLSWMCRSKIVFACSNWIKDTFHWIWFLILKRICLYISKIIPYC